MDGHRAFNSGVVGSRPTGGTKSYIHNLTISQLKAVVRLSNKPICLLVVIKCSTSLVGVMEAYLFYMQRAVVRFHYEVQKGTKSRSDTAAGL